MKIAVTDITHMRNGVICVAGLSIWTRVSTFAPSCEAGRFEFPSPRPMVASLLWGR